MSNPKDGNGFHFDFSKIPLVVIILAYICYFPVGVILTVLRLFGPSAQDEKQGDAAEQLKQLCKSRLNVTPNVAIVSLNTLPRSEKKTQRVFDHRGD